MCQDWTDVSVMFGQVYLQRADAPNGLPLFRWVDKHAGALGHSTSDWQKALDDGLEYVQRCAAANRPSNSERGRASIDPVVIAILKAVPDSPRKHSLRPALLDLCCDLYDSGHTDLVAVARTFRLYREALKCGA